MNCIIICDNKLLVFISRSSEYISIQYIASLVYIDFWSAYFIDFIYNVYSWNIILINILSTVSK